MTVPPAKKEPGVRAEQAVGKKSERHGNGKRSRRPVAHTTNVVRKCEALDRHIIDCLAMRWPTSTALQ